MSILISTSATIEVLPEKDILYIEAYQNYTKVKLTQDKTILSNNSLKSFDESFSDQFLRVHNSYILNLSKIKRYYRIGEVELLNGEIIPVARRRRNQFIEKLNAFKSIQSN